MILTFGYALAKVRSCSKLTYARAVPALFQPRGATPLLNAQAKWLASPVNKTGVELLIRNAMSSSVWPGTAIAQNDPSPNRSTLGPRGAITGASEKSMVENFDFPEKWFAIPARAKKLSSVLPKTNSVWGSSAGTPPV